MLNCTNNGTKNLETCKCECPAGYTGYNCASKICDLTCTSGTLNSTSCSCPCSGSSSGYKCDPQNSNSLICLYSIVWEFKMI